MTSFTLFFFVGVEMLSFELLLQTYFTEISEKNEKPDV